MLNTQSVCFFNYYKIYPVSISQIIAYLSSEDVPTFYSSDENTIFVILSVCYYNIKVVSINV